MNQQARFTHMQDGTQEDWAIIAADFSAYARQLPGRILAHLRLLEGDFGGFPVDRLTHSLQTASRAWHDGRDEEYVVCALLHDIGDTLGSYNHPDIAAAILKPFVSPQNLWMVEKHGIFQGYYSFITWAWIAICANNLANTRSMSKPSSSAPCMTQLPSTRPMTPCP